MLALPAAQAADSGRAAAGACPSTATPPASIARAAATWPYEHACSSGVFPLSDGASSSSRHALGAGRVQGEAGCMGCAATADPRAGSLACAAQGMAMHSRHQGPCLPCSLAREQFPQALCMRAVVRGAHGLGCNQGPLVRATIVDNVEAMFV